VLDLIEIRRGLHRIPELAFEKHQTSEMLSGVISSLVGGRDDIEITRYRTGIIVHVPAAGAGGTTIGWRADMDGLPVTEETGLAFGSAHPGLMHACGHDVHMTCALGILERVLARPQRNSFVFLFQPAEENLSGAQQISDAGLLDKYRISEFYALHVSPEWDAGVIATRPGTLLAGSSSVTVEFTGVAGHAGMPHRAVDPIVSVASFVLQIQAMIARNFDPAAGGVVLTFGTISGGTVVNGVAASATVMGTLRFLDAAQHDLAFKRIREIAEGGSAGHRRDCGRATGGQPLGAHPQRSGDHRQVHRLHAEPGRRDLPGRTGHHGVRGLRLPDRSHPGHDVLARHRRGPPAALRKVHGRRDGDRAGGQADQRLPRPTLRPATAQASPGLLVLAGSALAAVATVTTRHQGAAQSCKHSD
jgi:N-acetyldiaminopimelate deacetylase